MISHEADQIWENVNLVCFSFKRLVLHRNLMTLASTSARWLGSLALCFLSCVSAQTLSPESEFEIFEEVPGQLLPPEELPASPLRFEQAWDVVELMGQPMLTDAPRPARVLLRPQGGFWVDGGCNYFSGRIERDAQGSFRIFKYGGTHGGCERAPRSEAFLNAALVMVDNYRWDRGLLLRSGGNDLVRLQPSANQDSQGIEPVLANHVPSASAAPVSVAAPVREPQVVQQNCRQAKAAKPKNGSSAQAVQPCQPVKAAAKSSSVKTKKADKKPAEPAAKPVAKSGSKARTNSR